VNLRRPVVLATAVAASAFLRLGAAQQPIRTGVDTVPVYATVTDRSGRLVDNLSVTDFAVFDNGRRQRITYFGGGIQPFSVAILLDRSPSLFESAARTEAAVSAFTSHLQPHDNACLGTFGHTVSLVPELTTDPNVLLRHLGDDAPFPAGTALWDAIEAGRAALEQEGGRRVILVVTDAADNCSRTDLALLRTNLERDGVLLYAIGVRGREGLSLRELSAMARMTGGWYFELRPSDDVGVTMRRVADELHQQYVVGFSPQTLDDKVHRIEVKVANERYTVRARRSYIASSHARPR
jgi:VWFA-related protein